MSRPNIDKKYEDIDELLIQCDCGCRHYLHIYTEKEKGIPHEAWLMFEKRKVSLWETLRWWWKERTLYFHDMCLSKSDIKAIINHLKQYV